MYPPKFNFVFRLPPQLKLNNKTFIYNYQYYKIPGTIEDNWYYLVKDLRKTGIADGTITDDTFDISRNAVNTNELHPKFSNEDDTIFTCKLMIIFVIVILCMIINVLRWKLKDNIYITFFDLNVEFNKNGTLPVDMRVYYINYVPYHSKNQINRGLHRWNQHHAGWKIPDSALFVDSDTNYLYYTK